MLSSLKKGGRGSIPPTRCANQDSNRALRKYKPEALKVERDCSVNRFMLAYTKTGKFSELIVGNLRLPCSILPN